MHLCLIATTRGRDYALLERFFSSLARQEYRDFELILGDQNLPGHIDPLLQKYERLFPCKRFFSAMRPVRSKKSFVDDGYRGICHPCG